MLPLATPRLLIREFTMDDLDALTEVFADPQVLWWQEAPNTREQTRASLARTLERYRADGMAEYAVVLRAGGEVIGSCGPVLREVEGERLPELGWDFRSDHWGRGYASEAARAVLTHVGDLGLPRIYSFITPDNRRSQGVARRIGMTVERRIVWADLPHDLWARDVGAPEPPPALKPPAR